MPGLQPGGRGFDSRPRHQITQTLKKRKEERDAKYISRETNHPAGYRNDREIRPSFNPRVSISMDVNNVFTYHKPFGNQQDRYQAIRSDAKVLALQIQQSCPDSRERALALTNLQQAVMWANASIAINEKEELINKE